MYFNGGATHTDLFGQTATAVWWYDAIFPYAKNSQMFMCPSVGKPSWTGDIYTASCRNWRNFYAPPSPWCGIAIGTLVSPAQLIMLQDNLCYRGPNTQAELDNRPYFSPQRHNDGLNIGFFDGHAKWLQKPKLTDYQNL